MKFLIVVACAFAVASASVFTPTYPGAQHLPVIGPNGVPVDTPSVQQATAEHLNHKVEAHARNGDFAYPWAYPYSYPLAKYAYETVPAGSVAPVAPVAPFVPTAPVTPVYTGPQHLPVIDGSGVPVDTPAVQKAKADHFVHKTEAHARNGDFAFATPVVSGAVATPVVSAPVAVSSPVHAYPTTAGVPAVTANGVPLDTPEVAAAKANHFAAYTAEFHSRARRAVVYPTAYGYSGYTGYTGYTGYYPYSQWY
jgi:hypothetical protein